MAKKDQAPGYVVVEPLSHDGHRYAVGDPIELDDPEPLIAAGIIAVAQPKAED